MERESIRVYDDRVERRKVAAGRTEANVINGNSIAAVEVNERVASRGGVGTNHGRTMTGGRQSDGDPRQTGILYINFFLVQNSTSSMRACKRARFCLIIIFHPSGIIRARTRERTSSQTTDTGGMHIGPTLEFISHRLCVLFSPRYVRARV